jgi:hypothetical protein
MKQDEHSLLRNFSNRELTYRSLDQRQSARCRQRPARAELEHFVDEPCFVVIELGRSMMRLERPTMRLERPMMRLERPLIRLERPMIRLGRPMIRLERPTM